MGEPTLETARLCTAYGAVQKEIVFDGSGSNNCLTFGKVGMLGGWSETNWGC